MEQPRRLVKLGGALLRTRDDEPSVPEEWRATLLHKYLDNASRAALAQSSKAALQLMPSAIVTLHVRGDVDAEAAPAALVSSVRAARLAMTRTDKPTRIVIRQTGPVQPEFQLAMWQMLLVGLLTTEKLPHTTISLQLDHIPHQLLSLASTCLPGVESWGLGLRRTDGAGQVTLPQEAAEWKTLRHLTIHKVGTHAQDALWDSVVAFLPQLVRRALLDCTHSAGRPLLTFRTAAHICPHQ